MQNSNVYSSNWGGFTGIDKLSSQIEGDEEEYSNSRDYSGFNSRRNQQEEEEEEEEEEEYVTEKKEIIDTVKWSSDVFERHHDKYKKVAFKLWFGNKPYVARMMVSIPEHPANSITINSSFELPINGKSIDAGKIFAQRQNEIYTEMKTFVETNKTVTRSSHKGFNEPSNSVMIQSIKCLEVGSKIDKGRSVGIKITGIQNAFVVNHVVSWQKEPYTAVVSTKTKNRMLYESGSTAHPLLEAFHGSDKNFKMIGESKDFWGDLVDKCRNVSIMSGSSVWLFYHMYELIKAYIENSPDKKTFPPSFNKEIYRQLEKADQDWKKKNRARKLPSNIYLPECDLTDGYMGHVISLISNGHESRRASNPAWTLDTENPIMRIPEEFIAFVSEKLKQNVQGVVMTSTDKITVAAECKNTVYDVAVATDTPLYLTVQMVVFYPVTFYLITPESAN